MLSIIVYVHYVCHFGQTIISPIDVLSKHGIRPENLYAEYQQLIKESVLKDKELLNNCHKLPAISRLRAWEVKKVLQDKEK